MVTGFAAPLGKQAGGTVLLEAAQQAKHLTPLYADQYTGVTDTQATRLDLRLENHLSGARTKAEVCLLSPATAPQDG
jgi:hypothetical protein